MEVWDKIHVPPRAAASVMKAPLQIVFILHFKHPLLIYHFNNECFIFFFNFIFLMFHVCLRGGFRLFSFIFTNFKNTVENSLTRERLSQPRGCPCASWLLQGRAGVPAVLGPAAQGSCGKMERPAVKYCSHGEREVFPVLGFYSHLPWE